MSVFQSSYSKEFNINSEELWSLISQKNILELTHPYCEVNDDILWENQNHKDSIKYLNGNVYIREFTEWLEGRGFKLWIGEVDSPKSFVEWNIDDLNSSSRLTITVTPHLLRNWPKFMSCLPYLIYIKPKLTKYLYSVVNGFSWYIQNNKPIPKNFYGKHSWFS